MLFDALERRTLLSTLSITGTSGNDAVALSLTGDAAGGINILVRNAGTSPIVVAVDGVDFGLRADHSVRTSQFHAGSISEISIDLGAHNDSLTTDAAVRVPMTVVGGRGNDTLTAGGGRTLLYGGGGDDLLNGGSNRDTLAGGAGNDTLSGNRGNDVYLFDAVTAFEEDEVLEYARRGADTLDFSAVGVGQTVQAELNDASSLAVQTGPTDADGFPILRQVYTDADTDLELNFENVIGTPGNDSITGNSNGNFLDGRDGNDALIGEEGDDQLLGGAGDDLYVFSDDPHSLPGETDTITELAAGGNDRLELDDGHTTGSTIDLGSDTLLTQTGTRTVKAAAGTVGNVENADAIGAGDTVTGDAADNTLAAYGTGAVANGLGGNDRIEAANAFGGDGNDVFTVDGGDQVHGGAGDDEFDLTPAVTRLGSGRPTLSGDAGNDVQVVFADDDTIQMQPGTEELDVYTDVDHTISSDGTTEAPNRPEEIDGTPGNDHIRVFGHYHRKGHRKIFDSAPVFHVLDGKAGNDTLEAVFANASVNVGDASSSRGRKIIGGTGDDTLIAGETRTGDGTPTKLIGGAGNDTLDATGFDTVVASNGRSLTYADYSDATHAVDVDLGQSTVADADSGTDTLIGIRSVIGSDFNDTLIGDANDNGLDGGLGDDTIDGAGGDHDFVNYQGRQSAVSVTLGSGPTPGSGGEPSLGEHDVLINVECVRGTPHDDTLIGGDGPNIIEGGRGDDIIQGGTGNDTLLGTGGGGNDNTTSTVGNDSIDGDAGDDVIEGDGGLDTLNGGDGDDIFLNQDGIRQTITGGNGFDSVQDDDTDPNAAGAQNDDFTDAIEFDYDALPGGLNDAGGSAPSEARPAAAGSASIARGLLHITGTAGDDNIGIVQRRSRVTVYFSDVAVGTFSATDFRSIIVDAGAGNDFVGMKAVKGTDVSVVRPLRVHGGEGDDTLNGGPAGDRLAGEGGNDSINGGGGQNTLSGGYIYLTADGTVPAAAALPDGNDTIVGTVNDQVTYTQRGTPVNIDLSTGLVTTRLPGTGHAHYEIDHLTGIHQATGGTSRDTLTASDYGDTLDGGIGNDTIYGGASPDYLVGGGDSDLIAPRGGSDDVQTGPDGVIDHIAGSLQPGSDHKLTLTEDVDQEQFSLETGSGDDIFDGPPSEHWGANA